MKEGSDIVCIFERPNSIPMNECSGNNFILNGEIQPTELFDNSLVYDGFSVYEVIKTIKGFPVFFRDHFERLRLSTHSQYKIMLADYDLVKRNITELLKSEKRKEINIKIVFNYNRSNSWLIYLIDSVYPTPEQFRSGVKGTLFNAERKDPASKVIDYKLRSAIYNKLVREGAYESLLVNSENCITEGSRSNIFFLKDNILFTAPDEAVLGGITRKQILDLCAKNQIKVILTSINVDKLPEFDCVFMTGTSPSVLPFSRIDNIVFNPTDKLITQLRELYFKRAEESVREFSIPVRDK
jgi:branched-chain amino acid aminotransferase